MPQIPYKPMLQSLVQAYVQTEQNAHATPRRPMFEGKLGLYRTDGVAITSEEVGDLAAEDLFGKTGQNLISWYFGPSISVGDIVVVRSLADMESDPLVFLCESYGWLEIPSDCSSDVLRAVESNDIEALDKFDQQRLEWAERDLYGEEVLGVMAIKK